MVSYHTACLSAGCVCPFFVPRVHVVSAPSQEYTLAHIDKPDTLAGAEQALKKHEDFMSTMEANQDKIDGTLQAGQRLVDGNNLYAGKVQDKMDSIRERSVSYVVGNEDDCVD